MFWQFGYLNRCKRSYIDWHNSLGHNIKTKLLMLRLSTFWNILLDLVNETWISTNFFLPQTVRTWALVPRVEFILFVSILPTRSGNLELKDSIFAGWISFSERRVLQIFSWTVASINNTDGIRLALNWLGLTHDDSILLLIITVFVFLQSGSDLGFSFNY